MTSISSSFADDTNTASVSAAVCKTVSFARRLGASFTLAAVVFGLGGSIAQAADAPAKKTAVASVKADPLKGDVWHAINGTWPGTLVFDGKTKKVVLTPVGAQAIQATYEVTKLEKKGAETNGALNMTSADGKQIVTATFTLKDNKNMSLRFANGQRDETYVRMNPVEEAAEKAKLLKLIEQKKLGTLSPYAK